MIDSTTYGLSAEADGASNRDALAAAIRESAGQSVYVAAGVYAMRPLNINTEYTTVQFAPGAILQVPPDAPVPAILNIMADHVTIDGGTFDGGNIAGVTGVMGIRIYGSHSHIAIKNCTVRNTSTGIGSYNGANCCDWTIEGNTIEGTVKSHGIYLHGHPQDNSGIDNVRVLHNTVRGSAGNGIWVGNGFQEVSISGNHIYDAGRMGIEVWTNPSGNFVIAGNMVANCAGFGLSIAGTPHTICHSNLISDATSYGIEVSNSRHVSLVSNHVNIVHARQNGAQPTGIVLNGSVSNGLTGISIAGGLITGCMSGINVCGAAGRRNNIAISGLVIRDCTYGIRNVGSIGKGDGGGIVEDIVVSGCSIYVAKVGIGNSLQGGLWRGGVISGNNIHVTEGDGIDLFRAAELLIFGNRITGNDAPNTFGVRLRDHTGGTLRAHSLMVHGNHVLHFATVSVYPASLAVAMTKGEEP